MDAPRNYTVFTIGHGELSWDEFALPLALHSVEALVDVRGWPYSERAPQFSRDRLESLARRSGMEYFWMGSRLGTLTADGRVDYVLREHESGYRSGIDELMSLAHQWRCCLVSSQPDPGLSHRHQLIAQTLIRYDVDVQHILPGGGLLSAQPDLFHALLR